MEGHLMLFTLCNAPSATYPLNECSSREDNMQPDNTILSQPILHQGHKELKAKLSSRGGKLSRNELLQIENLTIIGEQTPRAEYNHWICTLVSGCSFACQDGNILH